MTAAAFLASTARTDFHTLAIDDLHVPTPAPGEVVVAIERLAITANTVTYALLGEAMHYWAFFPAPQPERGIVPAWGYARVVASAHAEVPVGARYYGYWPMTSHWRLVPADVTARGFTDAAAHRRALPSIYNRYEREDVATPADDLSAVYRPLFLIASMLQDALGEAGWHGAGQIVLSSASSKTAQLTAWCLRQVAARPFRLVGLTAARNREGVEALGLYDAMVGYDALDALDTTVPALLLDFAGDDALAARVHGLFGDALRASLQIGKSHWDSAPARLAAGPRREFFFAPSQIAKRMQDWGAAGFARHVGAQWQAAREAASGWTRLRRLHGSDGLVEAWRAAVDGRIPASESWVVQLGPEP